MAVMMNYLLLVIRRCLLLLFFLVSIFYVHGQSSTVGRYKSKQSGKWTEPSTWQIWDGASWIDPPSSQGFPILRSVATTIERETTTPKVHNINLPAGIQKGDLLLFLWADSEEGSTSTLSGSGLTGWTNLYSVDVAKNRAAAYWKEATGLEGSTFEVTTTADENFGAIVYCIRAGSWQGAPEANLVSSATGRAKNPDPPSLDPTEWEAEATMWLVNAHVAGDDNLVVTPEANYLGEARVVRTGGGGGGKDAILSSGFRLANTQVEDPGQFTMETSRKFSTSTIAIRGKNIYEELAVPRDLFPQVLGRSSGATTSAGKTHPITLPNEIAKGDLLLVFWADEDANSTLTTTGWTPLYQNLKSNRRRAAFYKIADGNEKTNGVTFSTGNVNETSAHALIRIAAGTYHGTPIASSTPTEGNNTNPIPPSLNPGWGARNILWIGAAHAAGDDNTPTPTVDGNTYSQLTTGRSGSSTTDHARVVTVDRELAASSEAPPKFTLGSPVEWAASTIAILGGGSAQISSGNSVVVSGTIGTYFVQVDEGGKLNLNDNATLVVPSGGSLLVDGELQMGSDGTAVVSGTGSFTLSSGATMGVTSVAGVSISGSTGNVQVTGTRTFSTGANYIFNGNDNQVTGNGLFQNTPGNITISNPGNTVSLSGSTNMTGTLTVGAGSTISTTNTPYTLSGPSSVVLFGGATTGSTIAGTGALTMGGEVTVNAAGTGSNGATISAPISLSNTTHNFIISDDGTSATDLTISGIISGSGFGITKSGAGKMVLSAANTYSGATLVNSGSLNIQHSTALGTTGSGTTVASGAVLELQGGISVGAESLSLSGAGPSANAALDNISGNNTWGGTITLGAAATIRNQSGNFTINNAIDLKSYQLTLTGNTLGASNNVGGGAGIISGIIASSTPGGSLRKTNWAGIWTLSAANTFTGGVLLNAGTLNINNSNALGAAGSTFIIDPANLVSIDNTSGGITTIDYPIQIKGDFTFKGTNNLNLGTGAITLTTSSTSTTITTTANTLTLGGVIDNSLASLSKAGSGTLSFGSQNIKLHGLTISDGTLNASTGTMTINGDLINNSVFNHNNGSVTLGGGNHNIGGTGALIFNDLTINAQNNSIKTLTSNVTVEGELNLKKGYFSSYKDVNVSRVLTIANGGSVTGGSDDSYVDGPISKIGTNGDLGYSFIFPVGLLPAKLNNTNGTYSPAEIKFPDEVSSDNIQFTVTHFHGAPTSITSRVDQHLSSMANRSFEKEYWDIHNDVKGRGVTSTGAIEEDVLGKYGVDVTLYLDNKDNGRNKAEYYYVHEKKDGPSSFWEVLNMTSQKINKNHTALGKKMLSVSVFDQREFSNNAVAGNNGTTPVTLLNFNARLTPENKVALSWATASESVNKGFRIERQHQLGESKFNNIGFVPTKAIGGNSAQLLYYNFMDIAPKQGATSYYRLVQEDIDGKLTNSEVRMVRLNGQSVSLVYPNPSKGDFLISRTADGKKMNVQVTDISGRIIKQINGIESATHKLYIDHPGIYNIKLTYPETGEQSIQRVIVH